MRLPAEDLCHLFGLVRLPTIADLDAANLLVKRNRALYQRIRAAGGTLYPASAALPMSHEDWRRHFGPAYQKLADAKRQYDPFGILTPGYVCGIVSKKDQIRCLAELLPAGDFATFLRLHDHVFPHRSRSSLGAGDMLTT